MNKFVNLKVECILYIYDYTRIILNEVDVNTLTTRRQ